MMTKTHHYLNLKNDPWPLIASAMAFNLLLSLLLFLKYCILKNFYLNLILILNCSLTWWVTLKKELNEEGSSTNNLDNSFKISMILFITSEVMFFFSMFWSYFHFFLVPEIETSTSWPPLMIKMFKYADIPMLNTLILLTSGLTITVAHKLMNEKKNVMFTLMKIMTIMLGVTFTILQAEEYKNSFFSMSDSTFGTTFFMLTGFHGLHVIIGSLFLLYTFIKSLKIDFNKENICFEMASWYWHFVDVVWLYVFYTLYYMNN